MRVLFVTNDGSGKYAGQTIEWLGIEFTFSTFRFEDLVSYQRAPDREPLIHRERLDSSIDEVARFDGVFSEGPEAILLGYVMEKRGAPRRPWLVNTVQRMRRAEAIRAGIRRWYGDDPLQTLAQIPQVLFLVTTRSHSEALVGMGLPRARITYCPSTTDSQAGVFPDARRAFELGAAAPVPARLAEVKGSILMAGTNNRDLDTLAAAAELLGQQVHVLTDLGRARRAASPRLTYHDVAPLPDFAAAVAHAAVLVLPVRAGGNSCGQQSVAIAQRLGTLVVASDVPAFEDYVEDGQSGYLVPPEEPRALAQALRTGISHAADAAMLARARARDDRDAERMRGVFRRVFMNLTAP